MMEAILLILAILSIAKSKKWVNPATIFLIIWAIIIKLSRMGLYGLNATDEKFYHFIFIGLISFFVGFVLPKGKKRVVISRKRPYTFSFDTKENIELNYRVCYVALICCILITLYKLKDLGFNFSNITLFGELNREAYVSKLANMLYEFIAYPLYNTFVCVTVVDFFFGKKDKWLIILTSIMCFAWMLVSGGRIAVIRLLVSIIICMSLKTSAKKKIAKVFSNIKFVVVLVVACVIFVHFTVLKGFEPLFNFYTDFAIQPKMFQYWAEKINGQFAYGAASLFGFIYPILYIVKNSLGHDKIPLCAAVYENIENTFNNWVTLGTMYRCNAYTSCFWYLYYDGRIVGIVIGMLLWGTLCKNVMTETLNHPNIKNIAFYILVMIGVIYSFTDMEFSKANYVLAFLFIRKICFCKTKFVFGREGGE